MSQDLRKKIIRIGIITMLVFVLFFVYFKFFLNEYNVIILPPIIVIIFTIILLRILKKKGVIEKGCFDYFKKKCVPILILMFISSLLLCALFSSIEKIPPQRTSEIIVPERFPDTEIIERISCDTILRSIRRDESNATIFHYRYNWGIRRDHDDTVKRMFPKFSYTHLTREYNLMTDTVVDGHKLKCGEKVAVDVQKKYYEGSSSKPFTKLIIKEYTEKGMKTYTEYENEPQSENDESNRYDMFFEGALAVWSHTVNVPHIYCSLASGKTSAYYTTYEDAVLSCDSMCKKAADRILSEFDYTEYKACLSTAKINSTTKTKIYPCGTAEITINRKKGFISERPHSCNSTGTWIMERVCDYFAINCPISRR